MKEKCNICEELKKEIKQGKKTVLFTSASCEICQKIWDIDLEKLGIDPQKLEQTDALVEVDVEQCPDIADEFGIEKTPTILVVEKGEKKEEVL